MSQQRPAITSKVLCVDDDTYLTDLMRYALAKDGYAVQIANTGAAALQSVRTQRPDVVILDVNLPDADGFELCAHLRSQLHLPVIMLTARNAEEEIIAGFGQGADDYITKPFSMQVLIYRLQAVLRRASPSGDTPGKAKQLHRFAGGWFDTEHHQISIDGVSVKLTATESKILQLLLLNEGQVLSAERILDEIWDYDSETSSTVIKTHIRYLRAKLATVFGSTEVIHTVRGFGYTFRRSQPAVPAEEAAG